MIDKEDINLERAMEGLVHLEDGGFGRELTKLKAVGNLIAYAGEDGGVIFQKSEVRFGILSILEDIASEIEEGLAYVDKEIIKKMRPAEARAEEEKRKREFLAGMHPVKTF